MDREKSTCVLLRYKEFARGVAFLDQFDGACQDVRNVVGLPDNRLRLLVKLLLQNHGSLSPGKRPLFQELTGEELTRIEAATAARLHKTG